MGDMSEATRVAVPYAEPASLPGSVTVPKAGLVDTLSIILNVFLPTIAKGVIIRRPGVLALADWLDLDRRAVRAMQRLRSEYGSGPVLLRVFGRSLAVVLDPRDVHRILAESPDPFATDTPEKASALAHFEPRGVLISRGSERVDRRRFNEQVLEAGRPVHRLGQEFLRVVESEAAGLRRHVRGQSNTLDWASFSDAWFRMVRRIIFGDRARNDHELSMLLAKLRSRANWAFLLPQRSRMREQLLTSIRAYLARPAPNSLTAVMADIPVSGDTAPEHQVPQRLFAFDAAGITTYRSLALLASHGCGTNESFLRATVLESLRLWPTSPLILRETTAPTIWANGVIPTHTGVVIFTPFFHRDDERLPFANTFSPRLWIDGATQHANLALIPFSEGPAVCPGRNLVLLLATSMLSQLISGADPVLVSGKRLVPGRPLPATLDHYRLRFELR